MPISHYIQATNTLKHSLSAQFVKFFLLISQQSIYSDSSLDLQRSHKP